MKGADKVICQAAAVFLLFAISSAPAKAQFGFGGGAASSPRFSLLMNLITTNSTRAMIMKLIVRVRKLPQASTAPCFFASAKAVAVTFDDNGVK